MDIENKDFISIITNETFDIGSEEPCLQITISFNDELNGYFLQKLGSEPLFIPRNWSFFDQFNGYQERIEIDHNHESQLLTVLNSYFSSNYDRVVFESRMNDDLILMAYETSDELKVAA